MVNAIADVHIKPSKLSKQRFVMRRTAAITVTSGIVLGIRLRFHNHAPQQGAVVLAFHQPATYQFRTHQLCGAGAAEEGLGEGWEMLGDEQGGYGHDLHALFFNIYKKARHKKQQKMSPGSSILSLATLGIICITPLPSEAQSAQKVPCYIQGDGLVDDNTKKALGFFDPDGFTEAQGVKKVLSFDKKMEGGQSKTYGICSAIFR